MRWFKHFTDNYRGRSVQSFHREFGHTGVSWYFLFTEICAEKINKAPRQTLTEQDCEVVFDRAFVESSLRGTFAKITRWLRHGEAMGLWKFTTTESELRVTYPILLNLLDSDARRSRQCRDSVVSVSRLEKNRIEKNRIEGGDNTRPVLEPIKQTQSVEKPPPIPSVNLQELSMSPEAEQLRQDFREKFGRSMNHFIPRILYHFGSLENYHRFVADAESSWLKTDKSRSVEEWVKILTKKEIGAL